MAPRFTLIQGGLSEQAEPAELRTGQAMDRAAKWPVDLRRPGGVDAKALSARRAALVRYAGTDPLHPVRGDRAHSGRPAETEIAGLVAQAAAEAVDRAVTARLRALRRPIRLVGAAEPARISSPVRPAPAANRPTYPRTVPAMAFTGIRPAGWEAPAVQIRTLTEPTALRESVEASRARVVGRPFGRWRALRIGFLRRAGEVVAGTLRLGTGTASVPWRRARA